ncbi:MAG: SDR family NAD(P)-dependent oxidoreductase, partial [Chloroflexota bacterium]|nr:SDR family NAD(P)-dependent oxidoreductase [Chloroflexota bacterium]
VLVSHDYVVGVTGRRTELLTELQAELPNKSYARTMDVADTSNAIETFNGLIAEMGSIDLVVISADTGHGTPDLQWPNEKDTIDTNVTGFVAIATAAFNYFVGQGSGHLVGISSLAAIRGSRYAPAYNASKAFVCNYLEGLRHMAMNTKLPIYVTDIQPGFVGTRMAQGDHLFWVASPEKAAQQIYRAIERKKPHAYVTRRWRLIAWVLKILPNWLYRLN